MFQVDGGRRRCCCVVARRDRDGSRLNLGGMNEWINVDGVVMVMTVTSPK